MKTFFEKNTNRINLKEKRQLPNKPNEFWNTKKLENGIAADGNGETPPSKK